MACVRCFKPIFHWLLLALLINNGCRSSAPVATIEDVQTNCNETAIVENDVNGIAGTKFFFRLRNTLKGGAEANRNESVAMIGRDNDGNLKSSSIITSGQKNHSIIDISFPGAIADLHNHPGNTAPSAGDLYSLIQINIAKPAFTLRFVCLHDGVDYALAIYDPAAASAFIKAYPPQPNPGYSPRFPDTLFNEFAEMKSYLIHINAFQPRTADEMATAFMLDKYRTGVALFKANGKGEFQHLIVRQKRNKDGKKTYHASLCP
jgi:hypothetical protein